MTVEDKGLLAEALASSLVVWSPPWFHTNWLKRAPWAAFWHHIAVFLSRKRPIVQLLMFSLKNLPCMLCCIPKLWPWLHFGILQNRRQHLSLSAPPLKSTLSTSAQTRATFNIVLNTKCTFFQKIYAEFCSELLNKYWTQIAKKYKYIWTVWLLEDKYKSLWRRGVHWNSSYLFITP